MTKNIDEAFTAFCALHEAFKGNNETLKEQRRLALRGRMRILTSDEWEEYVEITSAHCQLWDSEERIQEKINK